MIGTLKVTYLDDATVEGETIPADAIRFERQFEMPVSRFFGTNDAGELEIYIEHLWFFGWCVAKRTGEGAGFDDWCERVKSVEIVKAAAVPPTSPSRSRSKSQR